LILKGSSVYDSPIADISEQISAIKHQQVVKESKQH